MLKRWLVAGFRAGWMVLAVGILGWHLSVLAEPMAEQERIRQALESAREAHHEAQARVERLERTLERLATDTSAVEDEVRRQFRMALPGERLIVVRWE